MLNDAIYMVANSDVSAFQEVDYDLPAVSLRSAGSPDLQVHFEADLKQGSATGYKPYSEHTPLFLWLHRVPSQHPQCQCQRGNGTFQIPRRRAEQRTNLC